MTGFTPEEWRTAARVARHSIFTEGNPDLADAWEKAADQVEARLILAGGMALTAEQVEDVRTVAWYTGAGLSRAPMAEIHRLRALFPATEPAEDLRVHNHTPYRGPGPDGHCAEHAENGRLRGQCMADTAPTVGRCPKELEGDIESFPCVLSAGHRERCKSAGGLTWGYFTPDDPAEEETKAERCPSEIEGWGCSLTNGHDGDHTAHDQDGPAYVWPASSPVVPAPTETGPWQRIEDVPANVTVLDCDGLSWSYVDSHWRCHEDVDGPYSLRLINDLAPFVAAEEG